MPFEKGSAPWSKAHAKRNRQLTGAVRSRVDPDNLVEFHVRRAMRLPGVALAEDEDGEIFVKWDDQGIPPSEEHVDASIKWLSDRGWGMPSQSIHLEADFRAHVEADAAPVSELPAAVLEGIRALLRPPVGELPAPAPAAADVIDAEIVREEPAPATPTPCAEGAAPASVKRE